jgi:hypothetical protein
MSSNLESKAVFKSRCLEIGMSDECYQALEAASYACYSTFAYCSSYIPGSQDETPFLNVIRTVLNRPATGPETAIFRRLMAEAHTFVMADMKLRVKRGEDSAPRRMAVPERRTRLTQQQMRLGDAIVISGELEPSHWLVDEVEQQREDNTLRWISPEKCCSRYQELQGEKKESRFRFDPVKGSFTMTGTEPNVTASLQGELLVRNAFVRRSLAYDQSSLFSYTTQMSWVDWMFKKIHDPSIPGFTSVTLAQCMAADKQLWLRMSELATGKILTSIGAGTNFLDDILKEVAREHEITFLLLPRPAPAPKDANRGDKGKGKGNGRNKEGVKKDSAKTDKKKATIPEELRDYPQSTTDGKYLCWSYNLACGCKFAKKNGRCGRGWHLCMKCHQKHSLTNCPTAGAAGA